MCVLYVDNYQAISKSKINENVFCTLDKVESIGNMKVISFEMCLFAENDYYHCVSIYHGKVVTGLLAFICHI